jgi:hypothetical protein
MRHNSNEDESNPKPIENRRLSGSQKKTAFALRMNCAAMVDESTLNYCGFLTLTVGDYQCNKHGKQLPRKKTIRSCPTCGVPMKFHQIYDSAEANRRLASLRVRVLASVFEQAAIVTERHKNQAIHFHALGMLTGRPDIRTGFDFREVRNGIYGSVSPELKAIWKLLREKLPLYGFGRAELAPIRKCGEAVAAYISKYIEKNVCHRLPQDKGKKLVRYHRFAQTQLKPNDFEWATPSACAWRQRTRDALGLVGIALPDVPATFCPQVEAAMSRAGGKIRAKCLDGSEASEVLGPKWAFLVTEMIHRLGLAEGDRLVLDYPTKQLLSGELQRLAGRRWCRQYEYPPPREWLGHPWSWRESNDFTASFPQTPEEQPRQQPRSLNELVLQWQCRHCQTSFPQPRTHCCNGQLRVEKYEMSNLANLTAVEMNDYFNGNNRYPDWNGVMVNRAA